MKRRALLTAVLLAGGCGATPSAHREPPHAGAGLPAAWVRSEHPHAARLPDGALLVAWGAVGESGAADILAARFTAGAWGVPVRVNPEAGSAVAGRQVGPRVAVAPDGRVLVAWVDRARDPEGDILLAASSDGGRTFGGPVPVNDDPPGAGQEYHDLVMARDGRAAVAWLDERGGAVENEKQVTYAVSEDGGRSFGPNRRATTSPRGVCPCCRVGLAAAPDGSIHLAFRDREGEDLLIQSMALRPGASTFGAPVRVSPRGWRFDACPVDGPAIVAGPRGSVEVAWMDGSAGDESVWIAASADGGATFGAPRPLASPDGEAVPARPVLAMAGDAGLVAAWEDTAGRVWAVLLGRAGAAPVLLAGDGEKLARSPELLVTGHDVHAFWTEMAIDPDAAPGGGKERLGHAALMVRDGSLTIQRRTEGASP